MTTAGRALIGGGLLWQPFLAWEKLAHPTSGTISWYGDQTGFLIASLVLLFGFSQLAAARVCGRGRTARISPRVLVFAWALVTLGEVTQIAGVKAASDALTGIGGLLTYPATVVTGFCLAGAGTLSGWRRWVLAVQGLYMVAAILVPAMVMNQDPTWATEAVWQLGWAIVGSILIDSVGFAHSALPSRSAAMSRAVERT
ncbi:MAG: hypothetical protein ACTHOG_12495 [Marmoricola sp.]